MSILITPPGKKAIRINRKRFSKEVDLQLYISENPESIPVHVIKEDAELLIVERESPTPVDPIDILATDSDGELYIIETKLYRNPDKRQVLAQALDYGAALWGLTDDPDEWLQKLDQRRINKSQESLAEMLGSLFEESQMVLEGIKSSLINGAYHFLILMDEVHDQLKNLILFINENSRFSVYAVELEYYEHDGYQILIPHLFGAESKRKAATISSGSRRKWDQISFFEEVEKKLSDDEVVAIRKLFDYSEKIADRISWGTGIVRGSFGPQVYWISSKSLFTLYSDGLIELRHTWLDDDDFSVQCADLLKNKMSTIEPFGELIATSDHKFPTLSISQWKSYTDNLIQQLNNFIDECEVMKQNA